jgi:hypothetical protein
VSPVPKPSQANHSDGNLLGQGYESISLIQPEKATNCTDLSEKKGTNICNCLSYQRGRIGRAVGRFSEIVRPSSSLTLLRVSGEPHDRTIHNLSEPQLWIPWARITQQNGAVTQIDDNMVSLETALQAAANSGNLITQLDITGHAASDVMDIGDDSLESNGGLIFTRVSTRNLTPLFRNGLAASAVVNLQGCLTAFGNSSIAQHMSDALPGRTIVGAKTVALRLSLHGLISWFDNRAYAAPGIFKNGDDITPPNPADKADWPIFNN